MNTQKELKTALEVVVNKVRNNIEVIGNDLREFVARPDGQYFKEPREQYRKLGYINNWTQSFYTGMAYLSYKVTKDEEFLKWMYQFSGEYYDKVFNTPLETMHDTGFLYTLYAVALFELTGDPNMKKIGIKAADELAKRFIPNGGYIRAWGRMDYKTPETESIVAIIDCMMNLPLLFWASEATGHPYYKNIATVHADTTLKHFVREDYSVCHAYRFDEATGQPIGVENYCGYSKDSHWARGTAWAIYGFAIAYSYTKKQKYLDVAVKLAEKFMDLCEDDGIPVWDFRLPEDKPAMYCGAQGAWIDWDIADAKNKKYNRDTSAAAITTCGIFEILKHVSNDRLETSADKMLNSLIENYMDTSLDVPGLIKCQNGGMVYTSTGDYYFMEALTTKLYKFKRIW